DFVDDILDGDFVALGEIDLGRSAQRIADFEFAGGNADAAVESGEQRVDADPLTLEVCAFDGGGGGGEGAGDAELGGGCGGVVGDNQIAGAGGGVGELDAVAGFFDGGGNAQPGAVDQVQNVGDS